MRISKFSWTATGLPSAGLVDVLIVLAMLPSQHDPIRTSEPSAQFPEAQVVDPHPLAGSLAAGSVPACAAREGEIYVSYM